MGKDTGGGADDPGSFDTGGRDTSGDGGGDGSDSHFIDFSRDSGGDSFGGTSDTSADTSATDTSSTDTGDFGGTSETPTDTGSTDARAADTSPGDPGGVGATADTGPPGGVGQPGDLLGDQSNRDVIGGPIGAPRVTPGADRSSVTGDTTAADLRGPGGQSLLDYLSSDAFKSAFDQPQAAAQAAQGANIAAPTGTGAAATPQIAPGGGAGTGIDPLLAQSDILSPVDLLSPGVIGTAQPASAAAATSPVDPTANIGAMTTGSITAPPPPGGLFGAQTAAAAVSDVEQLPSGTTPPDYGPIGSVPPTYRADKSMLPYDKALEAERRTVKEDYDRYLEAIRAGRSPPDPGHVSMENYPGQLSGAPAPAWFRDAVYGNPTGVSGKQNIPPGGNFGDRPLPSETGVTTQAPPPDIPDVTPNEPLPPLKPPIDTGPGRITPLSETTYGPLSPNPITPISETTYGPLSAGTITPLRETSFGPLSPDTITPLGGITYNLPSEEGDAPTIPPPNVPGGAGAPTTPGLKSSDTTWNLEPSEPFRPLSPGFNAPMQSVPGPQPTPDQWNLEPTVPFRAPRPAFAPLPGPAPGQPGFADPFAPNVTQPFKQPSLEEIQRVFDPQFGPPAPTSAPAPAPEPAPAPTLPAPAPPQQFPNAPAPQTPEGPSEAPSTPAPAVAGPFAPAGPTQFAGPERGIGGNEFYRSNQGLNVGNLNAITNVLNQNPQLQQAVIQHAAQQNPAVAQTSQQQQQQIAAFQLNLYNQWAQILLNQGIQNPMQSPQWQQVVNLVNQQTNQTFGLTAQPRAA